MLLIMKTQFTKGEWSYNKYSDGDYGVYSSDGDGSDIVVVKNTRNDKETEANLKLVAAAPDILNALDQLINRIDESWDNLCKGTLNGAKKALLLEAREAIKKATE
jgi:hypothetical protein